MDLEPCGLLDGEDEPRSSMRGTERNVSTYGGGTQRIMYVYTRKCKIASTVKPPVLILPNLEHDVAFSSTAWRELEPRQQQARRANINLSLLLPISSA